VATSVSSISNLESRILELEKIQAQQMAELKMSAVGIVESFTPSNMLKSALQDVARSPDLRNAALNTAIGIGAGFLGRKLYVGNSKNIFKKLTGSAVQFVIANFVRKKIPQLQENNLHDNHKD
jgi:hypothetical protein